MRNFLSATFTAFPDDIHTLDEYLVGDMDKLRQNKHDNGLIV